MEHEAVETALARLYVDAELRGRFFESPEVVGAEIGLEPAESARVAASRERVELFAESLVAKRFNEVRRLLPRSLDHLGEDELRERFGGFAGRFAPEGIHKHVADAIAFTGQLAAKADAELRDAAGFDAAVAKLFHRVDGHQARPRSGPAFSLVRSRGRRFVLVRWWRSGRYHTLRLP